MDEKFVPDLLRAELKTREDKLEKLTQEIHRLRDKLSTGIFTPGTTEYYWLRKELETYEEARRQCRGETSALRQAIAKLERED